MKMTKSKQERQRFYRYYKLQTGVTEVNLHDVALFAKKMGWPLPIPADPIELLAKQFAEALREEVRHDKATKRAYKANLTITRRAAGDGRQLTLWVDVDEAPRQHMVKALTNYREQMVGEAVIGTNTADHWNRINPSQEPLVFIADLTDDVQWRLNAPDEDERAS
jgi:hypothetical protein